MKTMRTLFTLLLLALTVPVFAKPGDVTWTAKLAPEDARAGEGAQIVLTAQIEGDYHLYSLTKRDTGPTVTTLTLDAGPALEAGGPGVQPTPHTELDTGFNINVESYTGGVAFALPVKLKAGLAGAQTATVKVRYQVCRKGTCLFPKTVEVPVTFMVVAGTARPDHLAALTAVPAQPPFATTEATATSPPSAPAVAGVTASDDTVKSIQRAQSNGLFSFILLSFGAGFLALLTPCVFPMVPITVSFFAKRREQSNGNGVRDALAYCAGIVGTFTVLGIVMTLLFGAAGIGRLAANPYMNVGLAALFLILAANLLGAFEIIVPTKLTNAAQSGTSKGGFLGPLLMGLTFTLTSFTCTVAFVGTLLAAAAKGSLFYPVVGMLAFSTAFASPFLLALFPQYLAKLPRAGSWMVSVKAFMGFLEIAAAMKFLSNADLVWKWGILTRPVFLALWAMIGVIAGLYLLGGLRLPHDNTTKYGWGRRILGGMTVVAGLYFLLAMEGAPLGKFNSFPPPANYPGRSGNTTDGLTYLTDYQAALAQAKAENKLVFVNFTGWACTNCRDVENGILPQPEVRRELNKLVRVELYTDDGTPEDNRNQELEDEKLTGAAALPVYVIVSPNGQVLRFKQGSLFTAEWFAAFLRDGSANTTASR